MYDDLIPGRDARDLPARARRRPQGNVRRALILAGSEGMTGAAVMATMAAMRSGAGLVYVGYPTPLGAMMEGRLLEPVKIPLGGGRPWFGPEHVAAAIAAAQDVDAGAVGPGLGERAETAEFLAGVINQINKPLVIDASALAGKDDLQIFVAGNDDQILLISRFDNLGKGASGAAVECMNLMLGIEETTGLKFNKEGGC